MSHTKPQSLRPFCTSKPIYKHDCRQCIFLGIYHGPTLPGQTENTFYDLYYHPYSDEEGSTTVIARYGNKGGEYQSGMNFARPDGILPLYQAYIYARPFIDADQNR